MKSLDEYRKELEQDPAARRKLRKLEKEFSKVEESLTEEELIKYGLKPAADAAGHNDSNESFAATNSDAGNKKADDVLDVISRKM